MSEPLQLVFTDALRQLPGDPDLSKPHAKPLAHEVDLLNDLSHENVVKIVGFVEDVEKGVAWMVFDWEQNGNLREFIQSAKWELPERICLVSNVSTSQPISLRYEASDRRRSQGAELPSWKEPTNLSW